jgi:hypothetical protein
MYVGTTSIGEIEPDTSFKKNLRDAFVTHLDIPLAFAGAASLLGFKRPAFWALVGLGLSLYAHSKDDRHVESA